MQELFTYFQQILTKVPTKAALLSPKEWSNKPNPNKWSKKEILGHLCDSALHNWQRFVHAPVTTDAYVMQPYPQDDLVVNDRYQEQAAGQILQLWLSLNQQVLQVMQSLEVQHYQKKIILLDQSESTLKWLMEDYVVHLEHHLKQIFPDWTVMFMAFPTSDVWQFGVEESMEKLLSYPDGKKFLTLFQHGTMSVEIYEPKKVDLQQPHRQDELYVVISGTGTFYNNGRRHPFAPGDVLFVPAGVEHRFEEFSDDFKTWVIFYGGDGGEKRFLHFKTKRQGAPYHISTDDSRLNIEMIHDYLTTSYWAEGRTLEQVKTSLEHSLNFGLYFEKEQVGFARVVTDYSTFGYLADVFVLESHRGKGLGKWLCACIFNQSNLSFSNGWKLWTKDAQGLYELFGFKITAYPERVMEWKKEE